MIRGIRDRYRRQAPTVDEITKSAHDLVSKGSVDEAISMVRARDEADPDSSFKVLLRDLRHIAGVASRSQTGRADWPPAYSDPFPKMAVGAPEIASQDLDVGVIGGSVAHHGCLLVRGLFDSDQTASTLDSLQRAQEAMREGAESAQAWYNRFDVTDAGDRRYRKRVESNGGTWLADAPQTTEHVLATMHSVGVVDALTTHFGERPVFSLQKSTLRCMAPTERITAWHQDGSFLDETVRTINVWVALTTCGADHPASGLEIVPRRMDTYLPLEPELAKAAVSFDAVDELMNETPSIRPEFFPGDALIFDERLLHRTYLGPNLTEDRYALECWFFAPSHATERYTPFIA
jgi:hypothetical protein